MRRMLALAAVCLVLSSCGDSGGSSLRLGVRGVALDFAFSEEALKVPVEPRRIVRIIPAPPQVVTGEAPLDETVVFPPPPPCAKPPKGTVVAKPATVFVKKPPKVGEYDRHNSGTFGVSAGTLDLTLPFPPASRDTLSNLREVAPEGPAELFGDDSPQPEQRGSGVWEWDVLHTITPEFTVMTRYRLTPGAIVIVRRETKTQEGTSVVAPSPPVTLMELNQGVGDSWRSVGADSRRRTAMTIEGRIEKTERVALCGEVVDSYRVVTQERLVNLETGESSGTDSEKPNVYNIATQFGGLIVSTEQHYTQQTRLEDGTPIVLKFNYTSMLDRSEPQ